MTCYCWPTWSLQRNEWTCRVAQEQIIRKLFEAMINNTKAGDQRRGGRRAWNALYEIPDFLKQRMSARPLKKCLLWPPCQNKIDPEYRSSHIYGPKADCLPDAHTPASFWAGKARLHIKLAPFPESACERSASQGSPRILVISHVYFLASDQRSS
jgi:hypothetical protein